MKNEDIILTYQSHVGGEGWYNPVKNAEIAGTVGESKPMECYRITGCNIPNIGIITYGKPFGMGWSNGNNIGEDTGTTGLGVPLEAIRMEVTGVDSDKYNIWYRCHVQDYGFLDWSCNGAVNGTEGGEIRVEAIQIYIEERGSNKYPVVDSDFQYRDLSPKITVDENALRQQIVKRMNEDIGYKEVNGKSKYGERYGDPYAQWCSWRNVGVYDDCGLISIIPKTGYCPTAKEWFLKSDKAYYFVRGQYIPKPGDWIFFDYIDSKTKKRNGVPDHTGLVEGCDGRQVCTTEGNKSDMVKKCYYSIDHPDILGYGVPYFGAA